MAPAGDFRLCGRAEDADPGSTIGRAVENEREAFRESIELGNFLAPLLDAHRHAGAKIEQARQVLVGAVGRPDVLDGVDWDALMRAKLQVEMLSSAVQAANARLTHAAEAVHAAGEARVQAWTRYQERRRKWESPETYLSPSEEAALAAELRGLAGPA